MSARAGKGSMEPVVPAYPQVTEFENALRRVAAAIEALPSDAPEQSPPIQIWYSILHTRLQEVGGDVARLADIVQRSR
jgi:hypothetical protein